MDTELDKIFDDMKIFKRKCKIFAIQKCLRGILLNDHLIAFTDFDTQNLERASHLKIFEASMQHWFLPSYQACKVRGVYQRMKGETERSVTT